VASGRFKAEGAGATAEQILETVRGTLDLSLDEGALEGIDVWYEIRKALATIKGERLPEGDLGRTVFSSLQLDASLADGLLSTNRLTGQLPFLNLDGKGAIDMRDLTIDLALTAVVRRVPEVQADPLAADLEGRRIPLRISGDLAKPNVAVDVESLLMEEATDLLLDKLGLGSESENDNGDRADQAEDAARSLLRGLRGRDDDD
jgi:AsmA protein